MSDRVSIKVSGQCAKFIAKFAKAKGISEAEAADKVIGVAETRLAALAKYNDKNKGEGKKPAKKGAAKKPAAKKAAKAKPAKKGAAKASAKKAAKPAKAAAKKASKPKTEAKPKSKGIKALNGAATPKTTPSVEATADA